MLPFFSKKKPSATPRETPVTAVVDKQTHRIKPVSTTNEPQRYRGFWIEDESDEAEAIDDNGEIINCMAYSRKTGNSLGAVGLDEVAQVLSDKDAFIWIGLHDPCIQTMRQIQEVFDLHELALEDAFNRHQRPKVENYPDSCLFITVRTAQLKKNRVRYGNTSIFLGKQFVVVIRKGHSNSYRVVREFYHKNPALLKMGPVFVVHAILDYIVDGYLPITDALGYYLREQERNIFSEDFSKETLRHLYELKSQLVHMRAVVLPVQDVCNYFINHKKDELIAYFPNQVKPYFRDINDHVLRILDAINGLNEMLSVAMDTYMAVVNMGQNDVVRKLAAWAGILAVPTAVAGIYGMNFDYMPELHWRYGYFFIVAVMLGTCITLYRLFKKSRWL